MIGQDGRIVLANPQAETLFGYREAELLGRPVEVLRSNRWTRLTAAGGHVLMR